MKKIVKIGFLFSAVLVLGACGDSDDSSKKEDSSSSAAESSEVVESSAVEVSGGLGDTLETGGVKYTLNSIELVEDRNDYADTTPTNVIKIQYTMENTGEADVSVGMDLTVYDANDTQCDSYPLDNTMGAVAAGKKMEVTEHVGIEALGEIELQFAPIVSFDSEKVIFKTTVQ